MEAAAAAVTMMIIITSCQPPPRDESAEIAAARRRHSANDLSSLSRYVRSNRVYRVNRLGPWATGIDKICSYYHTDTDVRMTKYICAALRHSPFRPTWPHQSNYRAAVRCYFLRSGTALLLVRLVR